MNADSLITVFERVIEAPNSVARLRRFVLDLAVRGKLVDQSPKDEPASELIKEIARERETRVTLGEIKRGKPLALVGTLPFEAPPGWMWTPLGNTGHIFIGNSIDSPAREKFRKTSEGLPFIATKDVGYGLDEIDYENGLLVPVSDSHFKVSRAKSVLICAEGGSAGRKIGLSDQDICFGNKLLSNETWSVVVPEFVRFVYMSDFFYSEFTSRKTGIIGGISIKNFLRLPFPLPPLAEQRRIVAKLEALMALLKRLEKARTKREISRDRLTTASLDRLITPNATQVETAAANPSATTEKGIDCNTHARFVLSTFPAITTRSDQIKTLRQAILNLAICGKLVAQDPADEPVSELLSDQNVRSGLTPKRKKPPSSYFNAAEVPFACPKGWAWTHVQKILDPRRDISCGITQFGPEPKSGGVPTLRCSDVKPGFINLSGVRNVEESIEAKNVRTRLKGGEVLVNVRGTLGGVALVPSNLKGYNVAREIAVIPVAKHFSGPFIVYLMISSYFWHLIQGNLRGIAYKGLNLGILRDLPIPLPPVAEQRRIVAKVDTLMELCKQLEAALTAADTTRTRLLDALIHQAGPTMKAAQ